MKLDDLNKLELASRPNGGSLPDDMLVAAIIKVRRPNYVPDGVTVRARIDDTMFTASCRADALRDLERDPLVESVALRKRLRNLA
jgi:hypothetical protein